MILISEFMFRLENYKLLNNISNLKQIKILQILG